MTERLQKILARAGYGSRRANEALVLAGRVRVNGVVVTALGTQADAVVDVIDVDGTPIAISGELVYLAMNKPAGVVTTAHDPQRRRTVIDVLPERVPSSVVPVGRLDRDTEGLLLFTNDGELAHRLAHPRFQIEKEYMALVRGAPPEKALRALERGVMLDERRTAPAQVDVSRPPYGYAPYPDHTWLRLIIHEGKKRQVRRMCEAVGHPVKSLVRTRIGGVTVGRVARGGVRPLSDGELRSLRVAVGLEGS